MFIHGVITYIPTPEKHAENVAKQRSRGRGDGMVGLGIKKKTGGKPARPAPAGMSRSRDQGVVNHTSLPRTRGGEPNLDPADYPQAASAPYSRG